MARTYTEEQIEAEMVEPEAWYQAERLQPDGSWLLWEQFTYDSGKYYRPRIQRVSARAAAVRSARDCNIAFNCRTRVIHCSLSKQFFNKARQKAE